MAFSGAMSAHGGADATPVPPSSEGSASRQQQHRVEVDDDGFSPGDGDDGFDSEEFRSWMRNRRRSRAQRRRSEDSEDGQDDQRSSSGPPPEWDGDSIPFLDYQIKANLWLATTKAKPRTRGPLLLQKLSKTPFEAMKYLAKDPQWMSSDRNGEELLALMDKPENFGEDKEEDLISSLAKVTYHLRRGRDESNRAFFSRWDQAMRKVTEHRVQLPEKFVGFLLINALNMTDNDIKALLNFSRGSIVPKDIREWVRKHETKLQVAHVGLDKRTTSTKSSTAHYVTAEDFDPEEDEIHVVEEALRDLQPEDQEAATEGAEEEILEEHEAAEILSTILQQQKKKTYTQTLKAKKAKELSRGYGNMRKTGRFTSITGNGRPPFKQGQYRMTVEELKKVTKCGICDEIGHWHRECPNADKPKPKQQAKEANFLETEEAIFCGHLELSGQEELSRGPEGASSSSTNFVFVSEDTSAVGTSMDEQNAQRAYMPELHDLEIMFGTVNLMKSLLTVKPLFRMKLVLL